MFFKFAVACNGKTKFKSYPTRALSLAVATAALLSAVASAAPIVPAPAYHVLLGSGNAVNQFDVPGTYALGGVSTTVTGHPQASLIGHAQGQQLPGGGELVSAMEASISYFYAVVGPQDDLVVPLFATFTLHTSVVGPPTGPIIVTANANAELFISGYNTDIVKSVEAVNFTPNPPDISGTFSFAQLSGRVGSVFLGIRVGARDGSADAFVDPFIFIDPVFLSSNPGYSVIVSAGIGNAAPVPEPETYALLLAGLGLVGFVARRRQPSGISDRLK